MLNALKINCKIALFWSAIFLFSNQVFGQNELLELLPGAEKMTYNESTKAYRLLGGNLSFKYSGHVMRCDSAYYYAESNQVIAYSRVHISKQDTFNLYCDSLYYNGKTRKAKLWGNVKVIDQEYKLTCDSLEYDAKKAQGVYRHGGKVERLLTNERLTSRVGYFYPKSKDLFFSGNVRYVSDSTVLTTDTLRFRYRLKKVYFFGPTKVLTRGTVITCKKGWYQTETEECVLQYEAEIHQKSKTIQGDSLYYNPVKGIYIGKGNVRYSDTLNPLQFRGESLYHSDLQKKGFLTGRALGEYRMKNDTLFIHADTLYHFMDSIQELARFEAFPKVKIYSREFQGICDSLFYSKKEGRLKMREKPIIWSRNAELKGDKMDAFMKDTLIQRVEIMQTASAVMEVDSGAFYNQVGGKSMIAFFKANELTQLNVNGNAQTIYYPEEKADRDTVYEVKRSGMSRMYASELKVYLDSGEVRGISYLTQPDGVFYPMDQLNAEEQFVKDFTFNPALRPKSVADILKD